MVVHLVYRKARSLLFIYDRLISCSTGNGTQGLAHARQVHDYWATSLVWKARIWVHRIWMSANLSARRSVNYLCLNHYYVLTIILGPHPRCPKSEFWEQRLRNLSLAQTSQEFVQLTKPTFGVIGKSFWKRCGKHFFLLPGLQMGKLNVVHTEDLVPFLQKSFWPWPWVCFFYLVSQWPLKGEEIGQTVLWDVLYSLCHLTWPEASILQQLSN